MKGSEPAMQERQWEAQQENKKAEEAVNGVGWLKLVGWSRGHRV